MTPFLMQTLVLCGLVFSSITDGFIFGQMSGMIDEIAKPESNLNLTENEISWIASSLFVATFFGSIASGFITDMIGRKFAIALLASPILFNWIMLYNAQSLTILIVTRLIVGFCFGGAVILNSIMTAEYTTPKSRSVSNSIIMSVSPGFGTGIGHLLCTMMSWRYVALIGIIPTTFAVIFPLFWVESPSWLASKGRFDECEKAFRTLYGTDTVSEKELALLIKLEKSKQIDDGMGRVNFLNALRTRRCYNVLILSFAISLYVVASGRGLFPLFAITIIKEISNSSDIVSYTLLFEVCTIVGTLLSIVFTKTCNIRPLLLIAGVLSSVLLLLLSALLYFKPGDIPYMSWINVSLFSLNFMLTNAGPYPILFGVVGEIIPLDLKSYCVPICMCATAVLSFVSVKVATDVFLAMGYHGAFTVYMTTSLFCLFLFWLKLPETKGRTLQEIELFFQNDTFDNIDDLLSDQNTPLKV